METVHRKICLLGAIGVGKTSLVRRFVESLFSERYQATIGVKIDRKVVEVDDVRTNLVIWDLQGDVDLEKVRTSYLRGAAGVLLVADGTRPETLETASVIRAGAVHAIGSLPTVLLLNKADLVENWRLDDEDTTTGEWAGLKVFQTSAKTGAGVDDAFTALVRRIATT